MRLLAGLATRIELPLPPARLQDRVCRQPCSDRSAGAAGNLAGSTPRWLAATPTAAIRLGCARFAHPDRGSFCGGRVLTGLASLALPGLFEAVGAFWTGCRRCWCRSPSACSAGRCSPQAGWSASSCPGCGPDSGVASAEVGRWPGLGGTVPPQPLRQPFAEFNFRLMNSPCRDNDELWGDWLAGPSERHRWVPVPTAGPSVPSQLLLEP